MKRTSKKESRALSSFCTFGGRDAGLLLGSDDEAGHRAT